MKMKYVIAEIGMEIGFLTVVHFPLVDDLLERFQYIFKQVKVRHGPLKLGHLFNVHQEWIRWNEEWGLWTVQR